MIVAIVALAISIVAAENFYGDVAAQIAGTHAQVRSILNNPDQDPHLFEASPSVARAVSGANIVIYNGLDYDPWIERLLDASPNSERKTIVAGTLVRKKPGDNPHIWYDPMTMIVYARALAGALSAGDPSNSADYRRNLRRFTSSLEPLERRIAALRSSLGGSPVLVTEPVANYLLDALGMNVLDKRFALEVMNNTEPGAVEVAAFETALAQHRARLLVYNRQATDPVAARMRALAMRYGVPVVGVTETEPKGASYQQWMTGQLNDISRALGK